jgi:hypothetical protein
MNASKFMLQSSAEIVEKRNPNVFSLLDVPDLAAVTSYIELHPEIEDGVENLKDLATLLESVIVLMIDRGKLAPVIEWTPEAAAEIEAMRARTSKPAPVKVVAKVVVPAIPPAEPTSAELDAALVSQWNQDSRGVREQYRRGHDAKFNARFDRLLASGAIR